MKMTILQDPLQMSPHHIWRWAYCKIPYKCHHTIYENDHTARSLTNVTTPYMQMTIVQDPLQMSLHHIWRWPYCKIPYKCHQTIREDDHTARSLTNVTTPYMEMTILQDPLQMSPHHIRRWPQYHDDFFIELRQYSCKWKQLCWTFKEQIYTLQKH